MLSWRNALLSKHESVERITPGQADRPLFEEHMMRYEFAAGFARGKNVADIACGTGYGAYHLSKEGKAESVTGIDVSEEAIEYAREHYPAINLNFIVGDATDIELDNDVFDLVVSFETIEHVSRYEKYLGEMFRILKPGGMFIISTPNKRMSGRNPFHIVEFSPDEFRELLEGLFRDVKMYGQDHRNVASRLMLRAQIVLAKIIPEIVKDTLIPDRVRKGSPDREIGGFVEKDINNCASIICVCIK